jgi:hypothetical protein
MTINDKLNELCDRMLKSWKSDPGVLSPFSSSSSQHNEQNDNHLEYYVKQSKDTPDSENVSDIFNSNSTNGGTKMENTQYETPASVTTEPDAQSAIAITKVIDQVTRPDGNVSVSDAPEGPVPTNETFASEGKAIAPTHEEMAEAVEKAESGKCASCGQAMPIAKAANCSDCGKEMTLCNCMGKSADEKETPAEEAKETAADEKKEMKKSHSVWDGAFAPNIKRGM